MTIGAASFGGAPGRDHAVPGTYETAASTAPHSLDTVFLFGPRSLGFIVSAGGDEAGVLIRAESVAIAGVRTVGTETRFIAGAITGTSARVIPREATGEKRT